MGVTLDKNDKKIFINKITDLGLIESTLHQRKFSWVSFCLRKIIDYFIDGIISRSFNLDISCVNN